MQSDLVEKNGLGYDLEKEINAFDESKAGVKGLVDAGIVKIPSFFEIPGSEPFSNQTSPAAHLQVPVIDLQGISDDPVQRKKVVDEIQKASETWGFFQIVNHGVSPEVIDEMTEGIRKFHEQDNEVKLKYHSRDYQRKRVRYTSNPLLSKAKVANWRDTLYCHMGPNAPEPEEFPEICREIILKYSENVRGLGFTILELLSEALGLKSNHLVDMDFAKGHSILGHYAPACPEPNRTMACSPHKDPDFLTIRTQDRIGGLQVFHQNQWVDIPPIPGAFIVNIGDLLQLVSNNKFKSVDHRVLANHVGPRISVICYFTTYRGTYGPISELISDENPPVYKEVPMTEYMALYTVKCLDFSSSSETLDHFAV